MLLHRRQLSAVCQQLAQQVTARRKAARATIRTIAESPLRNDSRLSRKERHIKSGAEAQLLPLSANASVPSRATPSLANGTPSHAVAVDHNHTRPTAHTGLRDHGVRLMKRRERHCLCGGSQSQAEHNSSYCSDHCFLLGQSDAVNMDGIHNYST